MIERGYPLRMDGWFMMEHPMNMMNMDDLVILNDFDVAKTIKT